MKNHKDDEESAGQQPGHPKSRDDRRAEKLARALRKNLMRRKQAEAHNANPASGKNG